jgi:hypothetical protein
MVVLHYPYFYAKNSFCILIGINMSLNDSIAKSLYIKETLSYNVLEIARSLVWGCRCSVPVVMTAYEYKQHMPVAVLHAIVVIALLLVCYCVSDLHCLLHGRACSRDDGTKRIGLAGISVVTIDVSD